MALRERPHSQIAWLVTRCPVGRIRRLLRLTLQQAADQAGIHLQAFFLQEQGVYPHLLPAIRAWLVRQGEDPREVERDYIDWVKEKRRRYGEQYGLAIYEFGEPTDRHPFVQFRESLPMSRMGFAKAFGVQPSSLYRLEHHETTSLSGQLVEALRDAGLPDVCIEELAYRVRELTWG